MITFPINRVIELNSLVFCIQCNKLFIEKKDTKDHGICSLDCSYKYRWLSRGDFI